MAFLDFVRRLLGAVFAVVAGWLACVAVCASVTIQRHVFYLHKLPIWWSQQLEVPESFGFLHNQVLSLRIATSDNVQLYAWLIAPLALYAHHQEAFLEQDERSQGESDVGMKLLQDPTSQLVIYFHGNAGTVGQSRRTDAYRMITSGASQRLHVLAYDYRGFGYSTGHPTELGMIEDAVAVIKWAVNVGKVKSERIVLVAQSLGTAIAVAAIDALMKESPHMRFAGICLCAAFTDAPSVLASYKIGGIIPLLYPLTFVPPLRKYFFARIRDKWQTQQRLGNIVKQSSIINLTFVAATCDKVIPWQNTEDLFYYAIQQDLESGLSQEQIDRQYRTIELGEGGTTQQFVNNRKTVRKVIVRYGGHNGIMKWAPVALEVLRMSEGL